MDDDLLAEIKAEAEAAGRVELDRIAARRTARSAEEAALAARAHAARQLEIDALLEAERARQRAAETHRQAMFASQAPPPEPTPACVAMSSGPVRTVFESVPATAAPPAVGRGAVFYLNVVALPLLCVTGIILALLYSQRPVVEPLRFVVAPPVIEVADAPYVHVPEIRVVAPAPAIEESPKATPVKRTRAAARREAPRPTPKPKPGLVIEYDGATP